MNMPSDILPISGSDARAPRRQARRASRDVGLLFLRLGPAALLWSFHVLRKLADIPGELRAFPDPLGIGHAPSFVMALGAEAVCSLFVAVGLTTRLASLPIVLTMLMVLVLGSLGYEGADVQSALLYALPYTVLVCTGPGRWLLDHLLRARYQRILDRVTLTVARLRGEP